MTKTLSKFPSGDITPPPSKSLSHRALICAYLSGDIHAVKNPVNSDDISATRDCLLNIGKNVLLDCRESGSTLRFLMPLAAVLGGAEFIGRGRLLERPLEPYEGILNFSHSETAISVKNTLKSGLFKLKGNVSSQFVSGLLMALPLVQGDSEIQLLTPLESRPYVDMTIDVMGAFGVEVAETDSHYYVRGGQSYQSIGYMVEPDYSHAAFFLAAEKLGRNVNILGLNPNSKQGDREIVNILAQIGETLNPVQVDVSNIPDLVPPIATLCCFLRGESRIYNAARLRYKESDRLAALTSELSKLGADITETPDSLVIRGKETLMGGHVTSHNDHRIAMSLALASIRCRENVTIDDAECVNKSYPCFWEDWEKTE